MQQCYVFMFASLRVLCLWLVVASAASVTRCPLAAAQAESAPPLAAMVVSADDNAVENTIDVGDRKQLCIDGRFIADSKNIALRMNPAVKRGPVLLIDKPWEAMDIGYCVSLVDDDGLCRMWYLARDKQGICRQCYAQSKDGITWEKPNLGLIEYHGSTDNNIVIAPPENQIEMPISVFLDPVAPEAARYKAVAFMYWPDSKRLGMYVHASPDGIHWNLSDQRVFPQAGDMPNQAFYDSRLKKYVAYLRVWAPLRKVGRIEADDITKPWPTNQVEIASRRNWEGDAITVEDQLSAMAAAGAPHVAMPKNDRHTIPIVFSYDQFDPDPSDHYNSACVQYPWAKDVYLMFPSAYRHYPEPPVSKYSNDGLLDIQLATSRDGVHWDRLSREPYVPLGTDNEFDCGQMYMGVGMIRRGEKICQYYGGYRTTHGELSPATGPDGAIALVEQRLDRFVSADAAFEGGELTTPTLRFSGSKLVLNVNAGAMGTCKVAILDEQGNTLPGYSLAECDEIGGNHIEKTVAWKGNSDLSSLAGRPVRLRFVMRACKLFAFQFP